MIKLDKISLVPLLSVDSIAINTIISLKLEQKINEALVATLVSSKKIKAPQLQINLQDFNDIFSVILYYKKQEYKEGKWFYIYLAYNQEILNEFINNQPLFFGNNILNSQGGFLVINHHTHHVHISQLTGTTPHHIINNHLVIEEHIQTFDQTKKYSIECTIDSPYTIRKDLVTLLVPSNFYDYIADRDEIVIYEMNEENIEIGMNVKLLQNKRYIARIGDISNMKKMYFALEKDIPPAEMDNLLEKILTTAYSYHNPLSSITITLAYIPNKLEIGQQIQYNNQLYFLFKFTICINNNQNYCQLNLRQYGVLTINEKISTIIESQQKNSTMEDFIKLEKDKIFIRGQYTENKIHQILFKI